MSKSSDAQYSAPDSKYDPKSLASEKYPYEDKVQGKAYDSQNDWIHGTNPAGSQEALDAKQETLNSSQAAAQAPASSDSNTTKFAGSGNDNTDYNGTDDGGGEEGGILDAVTDFVGSLF